MREDTPSLTELPSSREEELRRRMTVYFILMGMRVASLLIFIVVPGLWKLLPAFFAVFSSYVAVVIANAVGSFTKRRVPMEHPAKEIE